MKFFHHWDVARSYMIKQSRSEDISKLKQIFFYQWLHRYSMINSALEQAKIGSLVKINKPSDSLDYTTCITTPFLPNPFLPSSTKVCTIYTQYYLFSLSFLFFSAFLFKLLSAPSWRHIRRPGWGLIPSRGLQGRQTGYWPGSLSFRYTILINITYF